MHRESLGDVRPLLHLFSQLLAALHGDRERADPEARRIEPGLAGAHVELPAMPGAAQELADAGALVDTGLGRGQARHAGGLVERRAFMRAAVQQREELAIDMEHDDVAAVDADHLVAARRDVRGTRDDVTGHYSLYTARALVLKIFLRSASDSGVLNAKRASS